MNTQAPKPTELDPAAQAAYEARLAMFNGLLACDWNTLEQQLHDIQTRRLELLRAVAELDGVESAVRMAMGVHAMTRFRAAQQQQQQGMSDACN
ncbi:MAG: hypothetical protein IT168_05960 [Bryobacterales bacterium]|nr:hypothetical protein [Bryobacterales bacterium]